jgi:hypothetical protein
MHCASTWKANWLRYWIWGLYASVFLFAVCLLMSDRDQSPGQKPTRQNTVWQAPAQPPRWSFYLPVTQTAPRVFQFSVSPVLHSIQAIGPEPLPSVLEPITADFFGGINFTPGSQRMILEINPGKRKLNGGDPIRISFIPGEQCIFGDGQACTYAYRTSTGVPVLHLTIHSGVGGEGQALRHALEGTGLNQALYSLEKVHKNLEMLQGVKVSLSQAGETWRSLELAKVIRIPAAGLAQYMTSPAEQALENAAGYAPDLDRIISAELPLIVFETCGWEMPGEDWAAGVTQTSASIYLGVIQLKP